VEVSLPNGGTRKVGRADKLLLSDRGQPTGGWEPGQDEIDYCTPSSLPEPAVGHYNVLVALHGGREAGGPSMLEERIVTVRLNQHLDRC